ncbi:protein kinase [Trypanosoma grayi]|uniref:protein kinase n=1 Tax=Trypanosoma grayi TaxID=71804 RepID=UPI0004F431F7|nr:protein kinase [Trypanosoma grayi]KEG07455.1 protein kinase [Trypanosoma grayi]
MASNAPVRIATPAVKVREAPFSLHSEGPQRMCSMTRPVARTQPVMAVRSSPWAVLDVEPDDLEVAGSTLDEPMTPQSFSSMVLHNELKKLNRTTASGSSNNNKIDSGVNPMLSWRDQKGSGVLPSFSNSIQCSSSSSSHQFSTCRRSEPLTTDASFHLSDNRRPPLPFAAHGYTEYTRDVAALPPTSLCVTSHSHDTDNSPASPPARSAYDGSAMCFQQRDSSRLWPVGCFPPVPKELHNVNVGRSRSQSWKSSVLESSSAEKQAMGNHQKLLNDKYVIYSKWNLGVGSYSKVVLCYNLEDKVYYAMKVLDRVKLQRKGLGVDCALHKVQCEIAIMKRLRHRNIVELVEVIDDPRSRKIYLVLELAEHGEIMSMRDDGTVIPTDDNTALPEREVVRVIRSIVSAAMYAHRLGIAHRDIKPQNILLTAEGDVKLSDFGVSIIVDDSSVRVRREGSVAFLPPEMLAYPEVNAVPPTLCHSNENSSSTASSAKCDSTSFAPTSARCTTSSTNPANVPRKGTQIVASESDTAETATERTRPAFDNAPDTSTYAQALSKDMASPSGVSVAPQVDLFKADVFSLGVTAFVLLMGHLPWRAHDAYSHLNAILTDPDPFESEFRKLYGCIPGDSHEMKSKQKRQGKQPRQQDRTSEDEPLTELCGCALSLSAMTVGDEEKSAVSTLPNGVTVSGYNESLSARMNDFAETGRENLSWRKSFTSSALEECTVQTGQSESQVGGASSNEGDFENGNPMRGALYLKNAWRTPDTTGFTWGADDSHARNSQANVSNSITTTTVGSTLREKTSTPFEEPASRSVVRNNSTTVAPVSLRNTSRKQHSSSGRFESTHTNSACSSFSPNFPLALQQRGCVVAHVENREDGMTLRDPPLSVKELSQTPHAESKACVGAHASSEGPLGKGKAPYSVLYEATDETNRGAIMSGNQEGEIPAATQYPRNMEGWPRSLPATKVNGSISADAIDFIRCCLKVDPAERSTMRQLYKHPWIQKLIASERRAGGSSLSPGAVVLLDDSYSGASSGACGDGRLSSTTAENVRSAEHDGGGEKLAPMVSNAVSDNDNDADGVCCPLLPSRAVTANDVRVSASSSTHSMVDLLRSPELQHAVEGCGTGLQGVSGRGAGLAAMSTGTLTISALTSPRNDAFERNKTESTMFRNNSDNTLSPESCRITSEVKSHHVEVALAPPSRDLSQGVEGLNDAVTHAINRPRVLSDSEEIAVPLGLALRLRERRSARLQPFRRPHFDEDSSFRYSRDDSCMKTPRFLGNAQTVSSKTQSSLEEPAGRSFSVLLDVEEDSVVGTMQTTAASISGKERSMGSMLVDRVPPLLSSPASALATCRRPDDQKQLPQSLHERSFSCPEYY